MFSSGFQRFLITVPHMNDFEEMKFNVKMLKVNEKTLFIVNILDWISKTSTKTQNNYTCISFRFIYRETLFLW